MTEQFELKVPTEVKKFETGAVRSSSEGRGRFDLIPFEMLERWAVLMEKGCVARGERNWEKGMALVGYISSAFRHLIALARGKRDEDHAAALFFNIAGFEWTRARILEGKLPRSLATGTFVEHELVPTPSVLRQPDDFAETAGPTKRRADPKGNRRKVPWLVGFETSPKPWRLRGDDGRTCTRVKGIRREGRRETDPEFK
jgi:hypothetical protein